MAVFDSVDMDTTLVAVDSVCGHSSDSTGDRASKLAQKSREVSRRKAMKPISDTEPVRWDKDLVVLCENCGHVFYRKDNSEDFSCPYCQAKHHFEPAEEVLLTRDNERDLTKFEKLVTKEKEQERRRQMAGSLAAMIKPVTQDTHFNDAKSQSSLQMGSAEYKEYVEDLQEQAPSAPDDQFHEDLEVHNAALDEEMILAVGEKPMGDFFERKAINEANKREFHDEVMGRLKVEASKTERESDDIAVSRIGMDNEFFNDVTLSDAEYAKRLTEYGLSK